MCGTSDVMRGLIPDVLPMLKPGDRLVLRFPKDMITEESKREVAVAFARCAELGVPITIRSRG